MRALSPFSGKFVFHRKRRTAFGANDHYAHVSLEKLVISGRHLGEQDKNAQRIPSTDIVIVFLRTSAITEYVLVRLRRYYLDAIAGKAMRDLSSLP